jgi:predicted transcriptional regulator
MLNDRDRNVLLAVMEHPGSTRQELSVLLGVNKSPMHKALLALKEMKLVAVSKGSRVQADGGSRAVDEMYATERAYSLYPKYPQYTIEQHADYIKVKEMLNTTTDSNSMLVRIYSFWYRSMYFERR